MIELDPDAVAASLWTQYRSTLAAAAYAKAHYFSMAKKRGVSKQLLDGAFADWQKLDGRRKALARRLGRIEERATG